MPNTNDEKNETNKVLVTLSDRQKEKLSELATTKQISMPEAIRRILDKFLFGDVI